MVKLWIVPFAALGRSMPTLFADTGLFAKCILLVLFVVSVISWAIIWDRSRLYLRLRRKGAAARSDLAREGFQTVSGRVGSYLPSVEGAVILEASRVIGAGRRDGPQGTGADALREALERRAAEEISELEKYLVFLATTSGVSPFLGLLGTVWGIMGSFLSMGVHGTASLEVVGPGIAEALVTTIAGLGAAIPALVGYNLLGRYVRRLEVQIDLLISRIVEETAKSGASGRIKEGEAAYEKKPV